MTARAHVGGGPQAARVAARAAALVAALVGPLVGALGASPALAASRGQYGGTLRLSLAGQLGAVDPLLSDSPWDAALLALTTRSVCQLERERRLVPDLAQELTRDASGDVRILLRPNLNTASGRRLTARDVARAWMRPSAVDTRSPYRALLFAVKGEARSLGQQSALVLPLALAFPWPDLEASLCHPALAIPELDGQQNPSPGVGPFAPTRSKGGYVANGSYARGRPYVDRLTVTAGDARNAVRLLDLGDADVGLATGADGFTALPAAPALFATYLAFQPTRTGANLRPALERALDRSDLTRLFVRAPSVPMTSLLPPALMAQEPPSRRPATPAPPARALTLVYDATISDQHGVAERLQVKLHDLGYRVALRGLSRGALRARWASGDFDLMLHAVLLPPVPGPALAIALDTAGRHDLLGRELPAIGAIADASARDQRARERALALLPELNVIPLYAQSLRVVAGPRVAGLDFDNQGIPLLDGAFFERP